MSIPDTTATANSTIGALTLAQRLAQHGISTFTEEAGGEYKSRELHRAGWRLDRPFYFLLLGVTISIAACGIFVELHSQLAWVALFAFGGCTIAAFVAGLWTIQTDITWVTDSLTSYREYATVPSWVEELISSVKSIEPGVHWEVDVLTTGDPVLWAIWHNRCTGHERVGGAIWDDNGQPIHLP